MVHRMVDLKYSFIIEATTDPNFFGLYSPDLEGFTGIGHSIEDCLYKAKWGIEEHLELLKERGLPVPKPNPSFDCFAIDSLGRAIAPARAFQSSLPPVKGVAEAALYCAQHSHPPNPERAETRSCPRRAQFHRARSASKKGAWPLPPYPSEAARCASTGDQQAPSPPLLREHRTNRRAFFTP